MDENHPRISSLAVGLMFASYQFVFLIITPVLMDILPKFGRRRAILCGSCFMSAATVAFACGALFENDIAFYVTSLVARSFQGAADALILVSVPSIIAIEWPEKNAKYQSYTCISLGLGLMLGPALATFLVRYLSYFWTLITFAIIVFVLCTTAACFIPKRIDFDQTE